MPVRTEKDLSEEQRAHWLKAVAAIELRNFGYAISLLQAVLRHEPEFLTGRQLLRRAEISRANSSRKRLLNRPANSVAVLKAQREIKRDPGRAIEMLEKVLEQDPYNKKANLALKEAAAVAGWFETAAFALQTLLEQTPRDSKLLHELGRVYHQLGDNEGAVEVYTRIIALNPADAQALRLAKDAAARSSMRSGGWAAAQSYRDLIKDKETAVSLEQQSRMQLADEALDRQIAETHARHEADPGDPELARRLGLLSEQKDDLSSALAWYGYAFELLDGNEPGLARKIADVKVRQIDKEITQLEEFLAHNSADAPACAEKQRHLAAARKARAELLITEARKRVERNPTDLQFRFELGECLVEAGQFREALPELQRARQNPNARLRAMNALGRCYRELGMLDLAARQLEEAAQEISTMDGAKKEIVYNLGLVYEQMKETDKSLACMKRIYEVDYGFRDVAARVENSYLRPAP